MCAGLVPLDANGPATLVGQKTFERHKQIRTQPPLLAADRFQISMFEQTREKLLDQILRLLSGKALPPDKSVKRSPISSTEYFECFPCSGRFALRFEHDAPMSGGECHCIKRIGLSRALSQQLPGDAGRIASEAGRLLCILFVRASRASRDAPRSRPAGLRGRRLRKRSLT